MTGLRDRPRTGALGRYGLGFARIVVPVLGWAIAVALHVAWNGGLLLTSVLLGDDTGLLEAVAVTTATAIVPAVLVLYAIARLSARHELRILRDELRFEVDRGTIAETEYVTVVDGAERRRALAAARDRGGRALLARQQAFFHIAADLAFRNHHRRQGEPSKPINTTRDETDRRRLVTPRGELFSAPPPRDD